MVPHATRPLSARTRILGAILIVACAGLAIVGGVAFVAQRGQVLAAIDQRLHTQVEMLRTVADEDPTTTDTTSSKGAATATEDIDVADFPSVDAYLHAAVARLVPARNEASVAVLDGRARYRPETLSGFDVSADSTLLRRASDEALAAGAPVMGTMAMQDRSLRYIAVPVTMPGDPARGVYIRAVDVSAELRPVTLWAVTYTAAAVGMLLAIGVVGWFVAGRLLSPIRHLRETADSITLTDLGARIPAEGTDDISDLTRTVNSMLDRLERSVDTQRKLLDDVRHELKTPLTIMRGHLELMNPADPDDVRSTRVLGLAELERLSRLVADIDLLATVEDEETMNLQGVDVAALTRRMAEMITVIPGHPWVVAATGSGRLLADPDRLLQAWLQLAGNAAKHTPAGSPVEIGSSTSPDEVRLWVRDHGPGVPPAVRHSIFRRFDRGGGKRSVGGSGLGLAIVEAIVTAHDGACAVSETPGGGATFTIRIPTTRYAQVIAGPVRSGDVPQREASA